MNVFLLAAGLGTRLKPLTLHYPKPAVPFLNVPMGFYQFRFLQHLPVEKIVVNTFHLPERVQHLYEHQPYLKTPILFSHEKNEILGSAGGLKKASQQMDLSKPILMMNADEIYFTKKSDFLKSAHQQHLANKNLATLVVMKHPEAGKKFGAIWCDQTLVKDIGKNTPPALHPWHYIGALFISPEILQKIPDDKETNIFYDILIHELPKGRVEIFPIDCEWFETGNPTDYLQATQTVLKNIDAETLRFISLYDSSELIKTEQTTSLISKSILIQKENLKGFNVISKTAQTVHQKMITDSVIFENEQLNASYFSKA